MSMEQIVKERHALEDRCNQFIEQVQAYREWAALMDIRSLELAMAKLLDRMELATDEAVRLDYQFKGLLLKATYDAKRTDPPTKRGFFKSLFSEEPPTPETMVRTALPYPMPLTEAAVNAWAKTEPLVITALLPAP